MSETSVGQIGLDLVVNQKQFQSQMSGIQQLAKKTGKLLASAFAVKKLADFGKQCLELGSDLQEVQNVVDVTFPSMSAKVDDFAKSAASSFGLSETMAKKFTGTYGAMAKAFGFTEDAALEMGSTLTGLAGDVASFYNITQDEAYTKLKSVFSGETETLKDLGIVMTQSALDAYALANGYGKTTKSMSEAEKVALRYAFIQDKLSAASGDFARTSDSWANQTRILKLQFDSLKASIGQGLINLLTPAIKVINSLIGKLSVLASKFKSFTELLTGNQSSGTQFTEATAGAEALTDSVSGIGDAAKKSAKEMKALSGFDELNNLTKSDSSSGASSGLAGSISVANTDIMPDISSSKGSFLDSVLGDINFEPIKEAFNDLKESVMPVVDTIGQGVQFFMDSILAPLGAWVIEDAVPSFFNLLEGTFSVLDPLLKSLEPSFTWLWDNFLSPISSWTGGIIVDTLNFFGDALDRIGTWMSNNQSVVDGITTSLVAFFGAWKVTELVSFIQQSGGVIAMINSMTTALWSNISAKIVDKAETMYLTALYAKDFLVSIVNGTAALVKQAAQWAATTAMKIADTVATVASTVATTAMSIATWALNGALAVLTSPITLIIAAVAALIAIIVLLVKNFDKVKEVATNVFKSIWNVIKSVINSILGGIERFVNGIVGGMNTMIKALNNLKFKVPDWVPSLGGKELGFSLKELKGVSIPRLAQGGYVKANTPQLAIIGDNRHQGEIVSPENKLEQMALTAAKLAGGGNQESNELLRQEIVLLQRMIELLTAILEKETGISAEAIFESVRQSADSYNRRTGKPAFTY